jgi:hypothetical protein
MEAPGRQTQIAVTDNFLVLPDFRRQQSRSERRTFDCHHRGDRYQRCN